MSNHSKVEEIRRELIKSGTRFWSNDNISHFVKPEDKPVLIDEATQAFEGVMDALLIDWRSDPNAKGTPRRLAKMYFNEILSGRYDEKPVATAFPNLDESGEKIYDGMIVVRAEIKSICSHHHQPVSGVAYIGILPDKEVIGLSKYTRLAQWAARRGTLQEELSREISSLIRTACATNDVGVYIHAEHGCCTNRGIMANSSMTQTAVLHGRFRNEVSTKQEFFDYIKMQIQMASSFSR